MTPHLRVATRGSRLALAQVSLVGRLLGVEVEPVVTETTGDRRGGAEVWQLGSPGVFVKEVQ
ncbi:MAG: hydroxymethylbilane synthase, partial [Actinobacteria bacterium]|nr:hydroxymethylbilane synthase [Actinomycetota bacterium]